jgi:hypothetical protein
MEERMGKKMNVERTDEALASASSCLATGCPFCNIMLSDGITERHASDSMQVRDVAQILLDSIEFHPESSAAKATNGNGNGHAVEADSYPATEAPEEMSDSPEGYAKPE